MVTYKMYKDSLNNTNITPVWSSFTAEIIPHNKYTGILTHTLIGSRKVVQTIMLTPG